MPDILTLLVMVIQLGIGFLVTKIGVDKAKKWVPVITTVTSLLYQTGLAFAKAAGAAPTPTSVLPGPSTVILAGFFGSFGNVFLDVFKDTLIQTFLVTGAHSAPKNTWQALKQPK